MPADHDARARQLAALESGQHADNLTPGAGQAQAALANTKHGAHSAALVADVSVELRELMDALGDAAPVKDPDGSVPAADVVALERVARLLRRYRAVETWLDLHGVLDERSGKPKPAADLADKLGARLDRALDRLGMNPEARSRLGVNLARAALDHEELWRRKFQTTGTDGAPDGEVT